MDGVIPQNRAETDAKREGVGPSLARARTRSPPRQATGG
jgi:hypothetical protein